MVESNPVVSAAAVAANPQFAGRRALDVFDAVVAALAQQHLMVILDNHVSRADWCCSDRDGNGLWHNAQYPAAQWLADWQMMAARYRSQPWVVGADLRNEPRDGAAWGGSDPALDWHAAAQQAGNVVLAANPNLLVIVEGVAYATDLRKAGSLPIQLNAGGHVVYSAHDYAWEVSGPQSESDLANQLDTAWGYLAASAPLWLGEFGTCNTGSECIADPAPATQGFWFSSLLNYLAARQIGWCYWPLNGTQASGTGRVFGAVETYGILNPNWSAPALPGLEQALAPLQ